MPANSMTGFGSADGPLGSATVTVELRTVNHRFFNPSLKLPSALAKWENDVREALRKRVARGHLSVSARIERPTTAGAIVDEVKFADYATALRALRDKYRLDGDVDLASVLRMPDVMRVQLADDSNEGTLEELLAVVAAAADALDAMRAAEGERLTDLLWERVNVVDAAVQRIAARAPERIVAQRDRLRENVKVLAEGIAVNEERLALEIAILADRLDVGEELDRFQSHIQAFRDALDATDGEPVGKRLGFLLQELLREANTTGSKANDAAIQKDVIAIKEELERIREQVENLE
jgi:uncharacterized protein (TIGR00255 family)